MDTPKLFAYYRKELSRLPIGRARQIQWVSLGLDPFNQSPVLMTWDYGQPIEKDWQQSHHLAEVIWSGPQNVEFKARVS